jgi:hypothetical protein
MAVHSGCVSCILDHPILVYSSRVLDVAWQLIHTVCSGGIEVMDVKYKPTMFHCSSMTRSRR